MYLTISNLTSYFFSSCSLTGCTREFLTLKKLKHHEKIHEGKLVPEQWISLKACAQVKPSSFCGRLPLWDWRVSFSGKNLVKLSEAQKRTQRYKWNSRKHWCHVTHASCKTLTTPLVSDKVLCGQCNKLFSNFWFLRLHELRVHSGEKNVSVPQRRLWEKVHSPLQLGEPCSGRPWGEEALQLCCSWL